MYNDGPQQVVKFTPETHHDYKALTNALERVRFLTCVHHDKHLWRALCCVLCVDCGRTHQVSEVALLVNESVRKKQNLEQLAELEKRLMGKYPVRHPPVGVSVGIYRVAHLNRCRVNQKNMTQAGRVLIHEGELTKLCRKVPKKVHLAFLCLHCGAVG